MTRQAMLAIVIGVIIILGAAAAVLYSKTHQTPTEETAVATQEEVTPENGMKLSSIADLIKNKENVKCTFSTTSDEVDTSGTVYISEENMRGDFDLTTEEGTNTTHMIKTGDTFYMWGDSLPTGMKMVMNIDEWVKSVEGPVPTGSVQTFDPNTQVDSKCSAWSVDSSLFKEPTDVKFLSLEGMIEPTGTRASESVSPRSEETNTIDQCSICNSLTGEAKTVCLQQLNCQ